MRCYGVHFSTRRVSSAFVTTSACLQMVLEGRTEADPFSRKNIAAQTGAEFTIILVCYLRGSPAARNDERRIFNKAAI